MEIEHILSDVGAYMKDKNSTHVFTPFDDEVPVSGTRFDRMDIIQLVNVALSGWVTEGKYCKEFMRKLCKFTGIRHAVLCNSGSSANLLAMMALKETYKVPDKSLIATTALSFSTTVAAILHAGFIPFFVDSNRNTLNPNNDDLILLADDPYVKGLIITHTLGFPIDLKEVAEAYHRQGKFVIEDCCDALGSFVREEHVGTLGDAATFSFFPAHHISTGEGGAVLMNDGRLFDVVRSYSNWGRDCWCKPGEENTCKKRFDQDFPKLPEHYDHKYIFTRAGYNFQMTDLQGALGSSQMDRIGEITIKRRNNYDYYKRNLFNIFGFKKLFSLIENDFSFSPFGFPITCIKVKRDKIVRFLEERNIRTRPLFAGNITRQPMLQHINYSQKNGLDGANFIMENTFWIGCHPELKTSQLAFVVDSFDEFMEMR